MLITSAVGLSRVQSRERGLVVPRNLSAEDVKPTKGRYPNMSTAHDHQPFSEQELALALQRSHLAVPTH